jgi:cbb3-type cytochrome c oxidase subunit III
MLKSDPMTRGPDLYAQHCNKCHVLRGKGEYEAPVHTGFGSRGYLVGMLHDPQDPRHFGRTDIDDMKSMDNKLDDQQRKAVVEFLFAQGSEPSDPPLDHALITEGQGVFKKKCMGCHVFNGEGADEFDGPDMTGYGSRAWLSKQIKEPKSIYGDLNAMTAFNEDLNERDVRMLAIYLRQERFQEPESGPLPALKPKKKKVEKASE